MKRPTNPKRAAAAGKAGWYNYYAGYSPEFVRDVIGSLRLAPRARVLDPWNGAGTTTQVADELGIAGIGYDINPVMVVIAKARLLVRSQVHPSEESLCERILDGVGVRLSPVASDPLGAWFSAETAHVLRTIESRIRELLVPGASTPLLDASARFDFERLSSLAAFFYVALFRVVRDMVAPFSTSNPTWIKGPASDADKLTQDPAGIRALFKEQVRDMSLAAPAVAKQASPAVQEVARTVIDVADSTALPAHDGCASAVVASPPYCTRIDYAVATRPELAVLGFDEGRLRSLRGAMIGSATVSPVLPEVKDAWGPSCRAFLDKVAEHPSKGSRNYYWKTHVIYFDGIARSLREINRVLIPGGQCVLVVQDSYYKEIHNDLPAIFVEMGQRIGWTLTTRHDYSARSVMATLHPGGRTYRAKTRAIESALHFTTAT